MCRRPAVSTITTSWPRARPASIASNDDRAGVRARLAADDLAAGALGPQLELLGGRGAEGVAGGEQHRAAQLLLEVPGHLPDRGRLAAAVHARHEDHGRLLRERSIVSPSTRAVSASSSRRRRVERLAARQLAALGLGLEPLDDLGGRRARPRRRRSASPRAARRPRRRATGRPSPEARRRAPRASSTCSRAGGGRSRGARARRRRRGEGGGASAPVSKSSCQVRATSPRRIGTPARRRGRPIQCFR